MKLDWKNEFQQREMKYYNEDFSDQSKYIEPDSYARKIKTIKKVKCNKILERKENEFSLYSI
jgi:hypothetical protein